MLIINTIPWAGLDFAYSPGDTIDLPDEVAQARIDAGLATLVPAPVEPKKSDKPSKKGE